MASSYSVKPESHYHVRSNSMPSGSHPSTLRIREELNKLKSWEITSLPLKGEMIRIGLSSLGGLYECVDQDLLQLPLTQQTLANHRHEKWVDELLDGSVRLLDMCSTTRDILLQMKESVQDLKSGLPRRVESSVGAYICSRKKMKKDIVKFLGALKRMENKSAFSHLLDQDHHLSVVVTILREVSTITISIFQSLLSTFMSVLTSKPKPSRWSLVSKLLHKGQVTCEGEREDINEVESVDVALHALCGWHISDKDVKVERVQMAQRKLKALEVSIEDLEDGLECMFKRLIQTRVSLLNIISH